MNRTSATLDASGAKNWNMQRCVIIGLDDEGQLRFGGSTSDVAWINFVIDMVKADLIAVQLEKSCS